MITQIRIKDAANEYLVNLEARGKARRTIHNTAQPLRRLVALYGDKYVSQLTDKDFDQFMSCESWGMSTRNLYLSIMAGKKGFFVFCRKRGYMRIDHDPSGMWESGKVEQREKRWLEREQFPGVLEAAKTPMDRAIVAIGMFTMCRGSEVTYLQWKDVDFENGEIAIYREKTKQEDVMPMASELRRELLRWKNHFEQAHKEPVRPDWYVVCARGPLPMMGIPGKPGRLKPTGDPPPYFPTKRLQRPYMAVKRTIAAYGLDDYRAGVHLLRRSSARLLYSMLLDQGHETALGRVSTWLGHADLKTTMIYTGIKIERDRRNKAHKDQPLFGDLFNTGPEDDGGTVVNLRRGA